ncbi:MAG: hypothetical protein C0600_05295 [Ignavibacteria bacterium]|nr:MAG: hypothetical protein C0600_05295 [Ignavibacteria bacterium]
MEEPQAQQPQATPPVTNFWLKEGMLRSVWSVSGYFLAVLFLTVILIIINSPIGIIDDWRIANPLFMLLAALGISWMMAVAVDRVPFMEVTGLRWRRSSAWQLAGGIAVAGLMQAALLLLELLFGDARIFLGQLTFSYVAVLLTYSLFTFSLVGFAEEILMRGYPFTILHQRSGSMRALVITAVIFSLIHGANPGIGWLGFANIFLAGIWLGAARLVTGALWLPIGLHIGWNFFLGSVFGFPVSGVFERSVFITEYSGPDWLTGGSFGPEGGLLATAVLIAGTAILYLPGISSWLSPAANSQPQTEKGATTEHKEES